MTIVLNKKAPGAERIQQALEDAGIDVVIADSSFSGDVLTLGTFVNDPEPPEPAPAPAAPERTPIVGVMIVALLMGMIAGGAGGYAYRSTQTLTAEQAQSIACAEQAKLQQADMARLRALQLSIIEKCSNAGKTPLLMNGNVECR